MKRHLKNSGADTLVRVVWVKRPIAHISPPPLEDVRFKWDAFFACSNPHLFPTSILPYQSHRVITTYEQRLWTRFSGKQLRKHWKLIHKSASRQERNTLSEMFKSFHEFYAPWESCLYDLMLRRAAILVNCSSAASKSSAISLAITSGGGSESVSVRLLSLIQKRSRLSLSRLSRSS